eukprot:scaffold24191_cov69-Phaeocystis_antarctica.AAC.11
MVVTGAHVCVRAHHTLLIAEGAPVVLVGRDHHRAGFDTHERQPDGRAGQADCGDLEEDERQAGMAAAEHHACSHRADESAPQLDARDDRG